MNIFLGINPRSVPYIRSENAYEIDVLLDRGPFLNDFYEGRLVAFREANSIYEIDEQDIKLELQKQLDQLDQIVSQAKAGEEITIWRRKPTRCFCNFLFLVDKLKDTGCKINDVEIEDSTLFLDKYYKPSLFIDKVKESIHQLTKEEMDSYSILWQKTTSGKPSRVYYNGVNFSSIAENYYDDFILSCFDKNKLRTVELISNVWYNNTDEYCNVLSEEFLVGRIEELCKQGFFQKVEKSSDARPFDYILRETTKAINFHLSVQNFAKENGYEGAWLQTTFWNGYTIYEPMIEGQPAHFILVKENEMRLTTEKEFNDVYSFVYPYKLEECVGKQTYVKRRDGKEFFGTCRLRNGDYGEVEIAFPYNNNTQIIARHEIRKLEIPPLSSHEKERMTGFYLSGNAYRKRLESFSNETLQLIMECYTSRYKSRQVTDITSDSRLNEEQIVKKLLELKEQDDYFM